MAHIQVNYFDLEMLRKSLICGKGNEGTVYFLNEKTVLKLYKYLLKDRRIYFEGLKSDIIAFPIDIYEYEKFIIGYTSKYCLGNSINLGFNKSILITSLIEAYNRTREEIKKYKDILMVDLMGPNIIYNARNDTISFIDTGCWYEQKDSVNRNLKAFDTAMLLNFIYKNIGINNVLGSGVEDIYQKAYQSAKLDNDYENNLLFIEFLEMYLKILENSQGTVKTIGELQKSLDFKRKS